MDFKDIDIGELGRNIFAKILQSTSTHGNSQDVIEECEYKGIQFRDESFPPSKESLINDWKDPNEEI